MLEPVSATGSDGVHARRPTAPIVRSASNGRGSDRSLRSNRSPLARIVLQSSVFTLIVLVIGASSGCDERPVVLPDAGSFLEDLSLLEHTLILAGRMRADRWKVDLFVELAEAYAGLEREGVRPADAGGARGGGREYLSMLLVRSAELAERLDPAEERDAALIRVVAVHAALGQIERALALADLVRAPESKSEALASVALAAVNVGRLEMGSELSKRCTKSEQRAQILQQIVRARIEKKDLKGALALAESIQSGHFRSVAFEGIAEAYYRSGQEARAHRLVRAIESSWIQSRTYATMSIIALERSAPGAAQRLLDKSLSVAEGIHDEVMRSSAIEDIAMTVIAHGRRDLARELAERSGSRETMGRVAARLVADHASSGRIAEAEDLVRRIEDDPIAGAEGLGAVALAHAKGGRYEKALDVVASIRTLGLRLPAVARVAVHHDLAGRKAGPELLARLARVLEVPIESDSVSR